MTVQDMERRVARRLVRDALASGHTVSVFDGGEWTLKKSNRLRAITGAMFSTDSDRLSFWKGDERIGWVDLIYGNGGWDVIADHSDTEAMHELLAGATALAERFDLAS